MANNNPAHVVLTNVRLSFVHLDKPYTGPSSTQDPKYSAVVLVPKSGVKNKAAMDSAYTAATERALEKYGRAFPQKPVWSVHDGDGGRPSDGQPYGDECKGMWVFTASNKDQPDIRDEVGHKLLDMSQMYSGVWAHVGVTFFGYNSPQKKGVGVALETVMKAKDDEPLGGNRASADDDFADLIAATASAAPAAPAAPAGKTFVGYNPETFDPIYK